MKNKFSFVCLSSPVPSCQFYFTQPQITITNYPWTACQITSSLTLLHSCFKQGKKSLHRKKGRQTNGRRHVYEADKNYNGEAEWQQIIKIDYLSRRTVKDFQVPPKQVWPEWRDLLTVRTDTCSKTSRKRRHEMSLSLLEDKDPDRRHLERGSPVPDCFRPGWICDNRTVNVAFRECS